MNRLWQSGEPFVWLTGGMLALSIAMVVGLVLLILANGLGQFWPKEVKRFLLSDGREVIGEVNAREAIPDPEAASGTKPRYRIQVKQGNRDLYGADFVWLDEAGITFEEVPPDTMVIERNEWGNLYGTLVAVRRGETVIAKGPGPSWAALPAGLERAKRLAQEIYEIEKEKIGKINRMEDRIRLKLKKIELEGITDGPRVTELVRERHELQAEYEKQIAALESLRQTPLATVIVAAAGGSRKELSLSQVVRVYRPNRMGILEKLRLYLVKLWEFLSGEPREANTEGGVFPAIFGTVLMVMIMSVMVTPLGVLAGFYLREYSRQGAFVSVVRIAVNNLAGVPSIVFGVFGVGFFIYLIGGTIDRLAFPESLPTPTLGTGGILWASLTLATLTLPVVIVTVEEGLAAVPRGIREASLALGATKFETTWRAVLPAVSPSILTGLILAVARAAGEVAPLMLTGVVKLAPSLPIDGFWPFLHLDRKFMHLGFHIYDVGFQSPNVDASRPMVFTTTLLLLVIVILLNLTAIRLRTHLSRKTRTSAL